jgi:hypothetical protein
MARLIPASPDIHSAVVSSKQRCARIVLVMRQALRVIAP